MLVRRSRKKKVEKDNAASVVAEDSDELEEATSKQQKQRPFAEKKSRPR